MERVPGEIIALAQLTDAEGDMRLVALAATNRGLVPGVLVSAPNAQAGALGFEPKPELIGFCASVPELEQLFNEYATEEPGTDPNDPRGLRGRLTRQPGMTS
jgi:hypothetical protein